MAYKAVKMQNTGSLEDIAYSEVHRYIPKKLSYDRAILKDPYSNSAFREIEMAYKESGRKMEPEYRKLVDILEGKTVEKEKYDSGYRERWSSRLAKFNTEMREIKTEGDYRLNRTQKQELEALLDNNYLKKSIRRTKDESRKASLRSFKSHAKRYVGEAYSGRKADYSDADDVIKQYVGQKTAKKETAKPAEKTAAKKTAAKRKTAKTAYSGAETKADEQDYSLSLPKLPEISDLTSGEEITREKNISPKSVYVQPIASYHAVPETTIKIKETEQGKQENKQDVSLDVIAASADTENYKTLSQLTKVRKAGAGFSFRKGLAYAAMFFMLLAAGKSITTAAKSGNTKPKPTQAQEYNVIDFECEVKYGKGNPGCILGVEEKLGAPGLISIEELERKSAEKTQIEIYSTGGKKYDEQDKLYNPDDSDKDKSDEGRSNYSKPGFHAAASADSAAPAATDTVKTDYNPNNEKPKFHARPLEDTLNDRPRFHAKPAQENIPPQETPYPIQTQYSDDDGLPKVLGATVMPSLDITDSGQPVVGLDVSKNGKGVTVSASPDSGYSEVIAHNKKIGIGTNTNNAVILEHRGRNIRVTMHDNLDKDVTVGKGINGFGYVGATTNGTSYASLVDGIVKVTNSHGNIEIGVNPDLIILKSLGVNVNPGAIFDLDFKNLISLGLVGHEKTNDMYNQLVEDRKNRHEYAAQARYAWEKMIYNAWSDGSAKSFVKNTPVLGKVYNSFFGAKNRAIKKQSKNLRASVDRLKNRTGSLFDLALASYADVELHGGAHETPHTHTNADRIFDPMGADIARKAHSELEQILDGMKNDESCRVDLDDGKIVFAAPEPADGEKKLITCGKAYGLISAAFAEDRESTGNRTYPMDRETLDELMAVQ